MKFLKRFLKKKSPSPATVGTEDIMKGGGNREESTPGEGVLTSTGNDRDASTG